MNYVDLVRLVEVSARQPLSNKLVDLILTTKSDEKMPSALAHSLLHLWQQDSLASERGLPVLLEAAVTLEPEKTMSILSELELTDLESKIKKMSP